MKKFSIVLLVFLLVPLSNAYGHGLGLDTISSVNIQDKSLSISVEMPMSFEKEENQQITITATDEETNQPVENVTFLIGLYHQNEMIFRNYFFTSNGILPIKILPAVKETVEIHGEQDSLLGAWHGSETNSVEITGPIFNSGGLYTFKIEIRT